jgi:hypothetical protein
MDYKKIKQMELLLFGIIGYLMGWLITENRFKSKSTIPYQELIKQSKELQQKSKERQEILKKHGEELDKMLKEDRIVRI